MAERKAARPGGESEGTAGLAEEDWKGTSLQGDRKQPGGTGVGHPEAVLPAGGRTGRKQILTAAAREG